MRSLFRQTLIIFILILVFHSNNIRLFATPQVADLVVIDQDTLFLRSFPLDSYIDQEKINLDSLLQEVGFDFTAACYRRYQAIWKIESGKLYLISVRNCPSEKNKKELNLGKIFENYDKEDGKISASWYSGNLIIPIGHKVHYEHWGWGWFYGKERELCVVNSRVKSERIYNNSKMKVSDYTEDSNLLKYFIYNNINWSILHDHNKEVKVLVSIEVDSTGKISNASIIKSAGVPFDQEAIRVVKMIPEWTVLYSKGKYIPQGWMIPVTFEKKLVNVPMIENTYWLFSASAQAISAFIAFLLTGFALVLTIMDSMESKDDTLEEIHAELKKQYYRRIRWLATITGSSIILSLLMVYLNPFDFFGKSVLQIITSALTVGSIVLGIYFVVSIINPSRYMKAARAVLEEDKEELGLKEEKTDKHIFIDQFINLETLIRKILRERKIYNSAEFGGKMRYSFRQMINAMLQNELISTNLHDELLKINKYRNLVFHGHQKDVDKSMVDRIEEVIKWLKDRYEKK